MKNNSEINIKGNGWRIIGNEFFYTNPKMEKNDSKRNGTRKEEN